MIGETEFVANSASPRIFIVCTFLEYVFNLYALLYVSISKEQCRHRFVGFLKNTCKSPILNTCTQKSPICIWFFTTLIAKELCQNKILLVKKESYLYTALYVVYSLSDYRQKQLYTKEPYLYMVVYDSNCKRTVSK